MAQGGDSGGYFNVSRSPSGTTTFRLLPFGTRLAVSGEKQSSFGNKSSPLNLYARAVRSGDDRLGTQRDEADRYVRSFGRSTEDASRSADQSLLHLEDCRSLVPASFFCALVREAARRADVEPRALAVRTLLHLPRFASSEGWVTRWQVERQLNISAERFRTDLEAARGYVPEEKFLLPDLAFAEISEYHATRLLTSLHYLKSTRPGSQYFALVEPIHRLPISLCSVSRLEWKRLTNQISSQFDIPRGGVLDISRVFSVSGAPRNAISLLLSKVRTHLRHKTSSVDLLVTTVDPNLGFTGCSYRAANWQQWMTVRARPYLYESGRYVTPRQLRERFGTSRLRELQDAYPGKFDQSHVKLLDSLIFCCRVNGKTESVPPQAMGRLHR
jgi:hypothetical protein